MRVDEMMVLLGAVVSTLADLGRDPQPTVSVYLALQTNGYSHEDFTRVLGLGEQMGWWTTTASEILVTDKGMERGLEINRRLGFKPEEN